MLLRRPLARSCLVALVALVALAARAASAQEPYARLIADVLPRVEQAVGLPFKHPPRFEVHSRAELYRHLARMLEGERPAAELAAEQRVMRIFGVIPDTLDWHALQLRILAEQVVGFYDPATKVLYLEDEPDDPTLGIVIPHELVHALQDQYLDLDSLASVKGDDDRVLAAQAALEGQATLVSFEVALGMGQDFPGGAEAIRESVQEEMAEAPVLSGAPLFVREVEIFPYLGGLDFMIRFQRERPGRQPFGADLPTSSAQILHPSSYFQVPRKEPLRVALPSPGSGALVCDNTFGELGTRALLEQLLRDRKRAARAANGWSGDHFALVSTAAGDAVAWLTVWETPADAAEFAEAVRRAAAARYAHPRVQRDGAATRYAGAERAIVVWSGTVDGRAAVLYEDQPVGARGDLLDLAQVRVTDAGAPAR